MTRLQGQARLLTRQKVVAVEQNGDEGVSVISQTGSIFHSRRLILSLPPSQQSCLAWSPLLPKLRTWVMTQWSSGCRVLFTLPLPTEKLKILLKAKLGSVLSLGPASLIWRRQESIMGVLGGIEAVLWDQSLKKVTSMAHTYINEMKVAPFLVVSTNIATGETSQDITLFHFFDNSNFHHLLTFITS